MPAADHSQEVTWPEIAAFHQAAFRTAANKVPKEQRLSLYGDDTRPDLYGSPGGDSAGSAFVRSEAFKTWQSRFPGGAPGVAGEFHSDPVALEGGLRALITLDDASAGSLVAPAQQGLIDGGLYRPATVMSLIPRRPVASDQVEYAVEASHTEAAAPVQEAAALTGTTGTKPEGGVAFSLETTAVRTFAAWVAVTRNVLADASALSAHIDSYLSAEITREIEDQVLAGNGTGLNFTGILNTTGVLTQAAPGAGESMLHVIRKGQTKVQVQGRTNPGAVVLNPNDAETIDLLERNNEDNDFVSTPFAVGSPPLWGMNRVVSDAMVSGTALVGDFSRCVLFDREQTSIMIGTAGDDFIRNIQRVLAEARAGFAVIRPKAFVIVDLIA